METLPTELVQAIALYCGWAGYASLRSASHTLHAILPWGWALRHGRVRTRALDTLGWDTAWFVRTLSPYLYVRGTWVLDGYYGRVEFLDLDQKEFMEGQCVAGQLHGTMVIQHPWRGGMSALQVWRKGRPVPPPGAPTSGQGDTPATTPGAPSG
jgi:hypothetical protein